MSYTAEIVSVGTELLLGNIANTDAMEVSEKLSELGINVYYHTVVGDNPGRLRQAVEAARERADIIITTGGLGPTYDDLTKQTLADCFGKKLVYNEKAAEIMEGYFKSRGNVMTENNYQQAYLPEGCTPFQNTCGTAPGCAFEAEGKYVLMLPGPPRECRTMLEVSAVPYLKGLSDAEICSHNIHIFGMGESSVEYTLHDMMKKLKNPTVAPYAKEGECMLRVTARGSDRNECEDLMRPVIGEIRKTLGDVVYSVDTDTLEETVFLLMKERGLTMAAAESCTGGLVSKRMTDIPGVSAVFKGGVVTYATQSKADILGVDQEILSTRGPVCREVAVQMAEGVRARFGADLGIGVTGVAGPDSDDFGNEVGRVYTALSTPEGDYCLELSLGNDRTRARISASNHALDMIRRFLTGLPIGDGKA